MREDIGMNKILLALALVCLPASALAQQAPEECRILFAKEWIPMGATSLSGCFRFADEAASPGERQFARLGDRYLKVEAEQHFQSADGGNTWEPVITEQPAAAFGTLNVLQPSDQVQVRAGVAEEGPRAMPVKKKKKKKRRRRSNYYQR
jgi:hypothetical protein